MARSVEDILLRVLGDTEEVTKDVEDLATRLFAFSKIDAEATAAVETEKAKAELEDLKFLLERLEHATPSVKVKAQIAEAMAELEAIMAEMDRVDGDTAVLDVDVRRGVLERIAALAVGAEGLVGKFNAASDSTEGWLQKLGNFRVALGPLAGPLSEIGPIIALLIPLITALGAAIVALGASLGAAVAGLGALAVAAGGVLLPALGLVFAGIKRFKDQADTSGTAANALKSAFSGIGDAAKALLPAVDPVLRALATGLTAIKPLIGALSPAFKQFGQDAAGAVNVLIKQLASPAIVGGLQALIAQAGAALRPLASIAGSVFRIFLNIANAAMPLLTSALQGLAGGIKGFADSTGNIGALRGVIGGLVSQLSSWLKLIGSVAGVLLELGKIAAPFGKQLVDSFTKGTEGIRNFLKSAEGSDAVKQFFADVIPLVQALIPAVAQLALAFIQIGQFLAPVLTPIVKGLTDFLSILNVVLAFLNNNVSPGFRSFVGTLAAFALPIGAAARGASVLKVAFMALPAIFGVVGGALHGLLSVVSSVAGALSGGFNAAVGAVRGAISAIPGIVSGIFSRIPGIAKAALGVVVGVIRGQVGAWLGAARTVGQAVVNGVRAGIAAVSGAARAAMNAAVNAIRAVIGAAAGAARAVINGVVNAIRGGVGAVGSAMRSAAQGGLNALRGLAGAFYAAGRAVVESFIHGVEAAGSAAISTAKGIADKVASILPGSEPKDKTSPFMHLDKRGEAFVMNFVAGIDKASPLLIDAVRNLGAAPATAAVAGVATTTVGATTNQFLIETPSGEAPDTDTMLAQIEMRMKSRGIW